MSRKCLEKKVSANISTVVLNPSCSQNAYVVAVKYDDCSVYGKVIYDLLALLDIGKPY